MSGKHTVTVEGFVATPPESRAAGNHTVTTVLIPVSRRERVDGRWQDKTDDQGKSVADWWRAEFWNDHGDHVQHTVKKNDLVQVTGIPQPDLFTRNDGTVGLRLVVTNPTIGVIVRRPPRQQAQGASSGTSPTGDTSAPWNGAQNQERSAFGGGLGDSDQPF